MASNLLFEGILGRKRWMFCSDRMSEELFPKLAKPGRVW